MEAGKIFGPGFMKKGIYLSALVAVAALAVFWWWRSLSVWDENVVVQFDHEAKRANMPTSASRVFFCEAGFSKGVDWIAFSAPAADLAKYVNDELGISDSKLTDVGHIKSDEIAAPKPPRSKLNNFDYWDLNVGDAGKIFHEGDGTSRRWLFIDTERSRLFYVMMK